MEDIEYMVPEKCEVCGSEFETAPTDVESIRVCMTCNSPYRQERNGDIGLDLDDETARMVKDMWRYYKGRGMSVNVCPGAMTLSSSPFNRTTQQDWERWFPLRLSAFTISRGACTPLLICSSQHWDKSSFQHSATFKVWDGGSKPAGLSFKRPGR